MGHGGNPVKVSAFRWQRPFPGSVPRARIWIQLPIAGSTRHAGLSFSRLLSAPLLKK